MRGETGPDFIEALARGLNVIRAFGPNRSTMTLSEVAAATGLARPTARRMLLAPDIYATIDRNAVYRPTASNDNTEQR